MRSVSAVSAWLLRRAGSQRFARAADSATPHVREREGRALREALPERCNVIALSPEGTSFTTDAFTRRLESWSQPLAAFVLGGPLGLDPAFRRPTDAVLSLSPMTLPHELARVVLAEQIYRAVTILRGVPYHK